MTRSESDSEPDPLRISGSDPTNERTNERTERMDTAISLVTAERARAYADSINVALGLSPAPASRAGGRVLFRLIAPHNPDTTFHAWWFPNGWQRVGPTDRRDRRGYRMGRRQGYYPEWFVLACNNTLCDARAVVPVSLLTNFADAADPEVNW